LSGGLVRLGDSGDITGRWWRYHGDGVKWSRHNGLSCECLPELVREYEKGRDMCEIMADRLESRLKR